MPWSIAPDIHAKKLGSSGATALAAASILTPLAWTYANDSLYALLYLTALIRGAADRIPPMYMNILLPAKLRVTNPGENVAQRAHASLVLRTNFWRELGSSRIARNESISGTISSAAQVFRPK